MSRSDKSRHGERGGPRIAPDGEVFETEIREPLSSRPRIPSWALKPRKLVDARIDLRGTNSASSSTGQYDGLSSERNGFDTAIREPPQSPQAAARRVRFAPMLVNGTGQVQRGADPKYQFAAWTNPAACPLMPAERERIDRWQAEVAARSSIPSSNSDENGKPQGGQFALRERGVSAVNGIYVKTCNGHEGRPAAKDQKKYGTHAVPVRRDNRDGKKAPSSFESVGTEENKAFVESDDSESSDGS